VKPLWKTIWRLLKKSKHRRYKMATRRRKQTELLKSKILLRSWSHIWHKNTTKNKQNSDTPSPQPAQNLSMPLYTEKSGGLLHHSTPVSNLLGRRRPTGEQINVMQYSHSHPWEKST
jgi:hypothetical protein